MTNRPAGWVSAHDPWELDRYAAGGSGVVEEWGFEVR